MSMDRDDRVPRLRVLDNLRHMAKCLACQSNFDTRLFVGCPYCSINNARKRRALDAILPTNPLTGSDGAA